MDDTFKNSIKKLINLENEKKVLQKIIQEDKKNIEVLHNEDSLERFARENYGHKKNNETIFIIENQDGIQ
jgi:cell division protein FtsB